MAEIKIEQKKKFSMWWLVVLVIAALFVYFIVFYDDGKSTAAVTETDYDTNTNEPELLEETGNNTTVAAYVNFEETNKKKMGINHEYTNEALLKLIEATSAIADEVGFEVQADLEKVRGYAKMITKNPLKTTHAANIRKASDILSNVLQNIQKAAYPALTNEVAELKNASTLIYPEVLTLEQEEAVKNYFAKASDLLQKMN